MNSEYFKPVLSTQNLSLNKPKRVLLNETPVVLVKSATGIVAFEDFCPHRGLALSEGFMVAGQLQCKYHGWSFDIKDGENTFVPAKNSKISCRLIPIFVKECYELIWLSYNQDAIMPTLSSSKPSIFLTGKIKAENTNVLENFLEGSHTHYVHDGLVRSKNQKRNVIVAELVNNSEGFIVNYESEPSKGLITQLLPKNYSSLKPVSIYIHPGIAVLKYINQAQKVIARFEVILITEGEEIRYFARIFINIGWLSLVIKPIARYMFKRVIHQDKKILELQQQNLSWFREKKFVSAETDTVGKYIFAWQNSKNHDLPCKTTFNVYW
jgi:phenylpropionate dioxygenase-like ring-hydroxylating dioxygenase large terminal subunit